MFFIHSFANLFIDYHKNFQNDRILLFLLILFKQISPMFSLRLSKETQDKVKLAKKYIEDKYKALIVQQKQEKQNWKKIIDLMTQNQVPASQKQQIQKELQVQQNMKKRLMRQKDSLKNYELYNLIGKGGFGEVRLARNRKTNEIVAIKRIEKMKLIQKKQISSAYIQKELMIKNCDSKLLVKLHSTFQDKKYVYLVMEYVSGGNLLNLLIEENIFTEEDTKFYIAELIVAIEEIHSKNFIHRDIKPDNILIDTTGHIKISDFGLSKYMVHDASPKKTFQFDSKCVSHKIGRQTYKLFNSEHEKLKKINLVKQRTAKTFSKVGTPDYISPEVLTAQEYDYSIDIWSVGVIMFQCLFGYPPFSNEDPKQVCQKVVNWIEYLEFPDGFDVSIDAKLLILDMINQRSKRLSIKQIKQHPFFFGIDWNNILKLKPPMIPKLQHELDTKNFQIFDQEDEWFDQNQAIDPTSFKKQQPRYESPAFENNNSMKKRSSSVDYLFAGFEYKNILIEPFKLIENKINKYQNKIQEKIQFKKNTHVKNLQLKKKSIRRFVTTQDENKKKEMAKLSSKKNSQKYIVKIPQSFKNTFLKMNPITKTSLQYTKSSSKIIQKMSFMNQNSKKEIQNYQKISPVKRIPCYSKICSKKII